jgi:hypothetical protein
LAKETSRLHETDREPEAVSNVSAVSHSKFEHWFLKLMSKRSLPDLVKKGTFGEVEEHPKELEEAVHERRRRRF